MISRMVCNSLPTAALYRAKRASLLWTLIARDRRRRLIQSPLCIDQRRLSRGWPCRLGTDPICDLARNRSILWMDVWHLLRLNHSAQVRLEPRTRLADLRGNVLNLG